VADRRRRGERRAALLAPAGANYPTREPQAARVGEDVSGVTNLRKAARPAWERIGVLGIVALAVAPWALSPLRKRTLWK
jgi:hypothetical protein